MQHCKAATSASVLGCIGESYCTNWTVPLTFSGFMPTALRIIVWLNAIHLPLLGILRSSAFNDIAHIIMRAIFLTLSHHLLPKGAKPNNQQPATTREQERKEEALSSIIGEESRELSGSKWVRRLLISFWSLRRFETHIREELVEPRDNDGWWILHGLLHGCCVF